MLWYKTHTNDIWICSDLTQNFCNQILVLQVYQRSGGRIHRVKTPRSSGKCWEFRPRETLKKTAGYKWQTMVVFETCDVVFSIVNIGFFFHHDLSIWGRPMWNPWAFGPVLLCWLGGPSGDASPFFGQIWICFETVELCLTWLGFFNSM